MHRRADCDDRWGLDSNLRNQRTQNGTDTLVDYSASNRNADHMTTFLRNKISNTKITTTPNEGQKGISNPKNSLSLTNNTDNIFLQERELNQCFESKDGNIDVIQESEGKKKRKKKRSRMDDRSSRRKREKRGEKSITLEEFLGLDATGKIKAIKDSSKKLIKGFYKEIFIQNILKNFEEPIKENQNFITDSGFPFKIEEVDKRIAMKKGQYIKLFENPNFVPLCRKYQISVLDGEKYSRVTATEKIAKTFVKTGERKYELPKLDNSRISSDFISSISASFGDIFDRHRGQWQMWGPLN